jgi:quercetin dioxygenase-like cupin family protein
MRCRAIVHAAVLVLALTTTFAAGSPDEIRLTPAAIEGLASAGAGAGTSGVAGIQAVTLQGEPSAAGPYTIVIRVPPHTRIAAHRHRDARSGIVVSGTWYFGYGSSALDGETRALPPGSYYTEPADRAHFAMTRDEPAVVYITGYGPTDTRYVEAGADPRDH